LAVIKLELGFKIVFSYPAIHPKMSNNKLSVG